ncbi:hypothetical protein NQ318_020716 [Aromia moschata]|uniref:DDE-1 domain-containing protein n=1 Tax=Aromia moschata TaxID=1265417 RepID=A0AAV8YX30_9CUCU|nr:hypothetical protein NQ318_020716 [Aromia moschata]
MRKKTQNHLKIIFRDQILFAMGFLRRHKDKISERMCQNIKRARAGISPTTINAYFDNLAESIKDIPPSNIINYDETNLTDDPGRKKVIVKRGLKYPERVLNNSKSATSLMLACSGKTALHKYESWTVGGPKGARYNSTPSGWFDSRCFEDWVKTIIIPYCKNLEGAKILIGDNLSSHLSIDCIKLWEDQIISFVFLPSNSTHLTQPLDVTFFRLLKIVWRSILSSWKKKTAGRKETSVPKTVFPKKK